MTNERIIDRIQKMLRLANDGGATEGEADAAMALAQKIMAENNLSMATIEAAGEASADPEAAKREREHQNKGAMYRWQRSLMAMLAKVNFCHVTITNARDGRSRNSKGYNIIGRTSNVVAVQTMFDYLCSSVTRLMTEAIKEGGHHNRSTFAMTFCEGASDRLIRRLHARHEEYLKTQREKAEAANRNSPAGPSTSSALVVVMADYAQDEEWANYDFRFGYAPGTTKRRHAEAEAANAAARAAARQKKADLIAQGFDETVAEYMANYGWTEEYTRDFLKKNSQDKPETKAEREHRERDNRRWQERMNRQYEKAARRASEPGYRAGRVAGDSIGLDPQVKHGSNKNPNTKEIGSK
jgi:hypothetical protein